MVKEQKIKREKPIEKSLQKKSMQDRKDMIKGGKSENSKREDDKTRRG